MNIATVNGIVTTISSLYFVTKALNVNQFLLASPTNDTFDSLVKVHFRSLFETGEDTPK